MCGVYHNVFREHLHRHVTERELVYSIRRLDDGARVLTTIRLSEGRRFTYREPFAWHSEAIRLTHFAPVHSSD